MKKICLFLFTLIYFCPTQAYNVDKKINTSLAQEMSKDPSLYWRKLTNSLLDYVHSQSNSIWKHWKTQLNESQPNISKGCLDIVEYIIQHPLEEEWTAQIINSMSTNWPTGILSGSTTSLGDFDQCMSTSGTFKGTPLVGKYCLATIALPKIDRLAKPLTVNLSSDLGESPKWIGKHIRQWHFNDDWYDMANGVCFPSICKTEEIKSVLQTYYPVLKSLEFNVTYCQSANEPEKYSLGAIVSIIILSLASFLVLLGTLIEILELLEFVDFKKHSWCEGMRSFSAINNTRILFSLEGEGKKSAEDEQFQYIHGVRALVSFVVIYFHATHYTPVKFAMKVAVFARHPGDLNSFVTLITNPTLLSHILVQAFFVMSGMLLTFTALSRKLKVPFPVYVLLRWIRYTPTLIGMLCFMFLAVHHGSGPLFSSEMSDELIVSCRANWWKNLLYIHNFDRFDEMCHPASWYLAGEMQLHVIAFVLLLVYRCSSRLTYLTSGAFVLTGFLTFVNLASKPSFQHLLLHLRSYTDFVSNMEYFKLFHTAPYMYFISYFLGCIVGQLLLEKVKLPISPSTGRFLMILSWCTLVGLPFVPMPFLPSDHTSVNPDTPNYPLSISLATLLLCSSLSSSWLMYYGATNPDNFLSRFFSAKIFHPLSRLSFTLYLVHTVIIWFDAHQSRTPISVVNYEQMSKVLSTTYWRSFYYAYILFLTFEAPFVNILKWAFEDKIKAAKKKQ